MAKTGDSRRSTVLPWVGFAIVATLVTMDVLANVVIGLDGTIRPYVSLAALALSPVATLLWRNRDDRRPTVLVNLLTLVGQGLAIAPTAFAGSMGIMFGILPVFTHR